MFWDKVACVYDIFADIINRGANKKLCADADFKRAFTPDSYRHFLEAAGYTDARYTLCSGRVPCAVAVLRKSGCPSDKKYPEAQGSGQKGMDAK